MNDVQGGRILPRVTLVGAGPGDPGLLTIKGLKAIQDADVVLYDALISDEILKEIPSTAMSVNVGKRAGVHSMPQEDINDLIVMMARKHGHVVRLKGGDPFIFGRGFEELRYTIAKGIQASVIPGVSSVIAAPASVNIAITLRGTSEGFLVITGTTATGELSNEIQTAVNADCTVIILMGFGKIDEIMTAFSEGGKGNTPVAVIENATLPTCKSATGVVSNISEKVREGGIHPPAVIVIGEVVRAADELSMIATSVFTPQLK
jgi:uroporphyrin-III C-methyltransferase